MYEIIYRSRVAISRRLLRSSTLWSYCLLTKISTFRATRFWRCVMAGGLKPSLSTSMFKSLGWDQNSTRCWFTSFCLRRCWDFCRRRSRVPNSRTFFAHCRREYMRIVSFGWRNTARNFIEMPWARTMTLWGRVCSSFWPNADAWSRILLQSRLKRKCFRIAFLIDFHLCWYHRRTLQLVSTRSVQRWGMTSNLSWLSRRNSQVQECSDYKRAGEKYPKMETMALTEITKNGICEIFRMTSEQNPSAPPNLQNITLQDPHPIFGPQSLSQRQHLSTSKQSFQDMIHRKWSRLT